MAGALVNGVWVAVADTFHDPPDGILGLFFVVFWVALFSLVPVFFISLAYGVPVYLLLHRLHFANVATAVVFGALPGVCWDLWTEHAVDIRSSLPAAGIAAGLTYHLIHTRVWSSNYRLERP